MHVRMWHDYTLSQVWSCHWQYYYTVVLLNNNQYDVRLETLYLFRALSPWCSPLCPRVLWQVIQFSSFVQNHMNLALKLSLSKSQSEKPTNFSADLVAMSWWNRRWSMWRTCMETRWVVPKIYLHLKYFSFPQKFTWRHKLFIFKYQTWIIKVETLLSVKLQAQLAGSWEGVAATPGRAPLHLLLGWRQGQPYLSILVHHGL